MTAFWPRRTEGSDHESEVGEEGRGMLLWDCAGESVDDLLLQGE
ncbi:hypothetical protein [Streptomyces sp. HSG2]|nr:hypothetical protein [Streptomyces sp. HSG2]